jgi:hypothetical protein
VAGRWLLRDSFALNASWQRLYPQDKPALSQVSRGCQLAIKAKDLSTHIRRMAAHRLAQKIIICVLYGG